MSDILLTLIICSACCVLIGGIITALYIVKLARGKRVLKNELRAYLEIRNTESRMAKEGGATESKVTTQKEGMIP